MATPSWIRKMLTRRGIPFEELRHGRVFTAQDLAHTEHFSGDRVAKVVVVVVDGRLVELILPASRNVNLDRVRVILGARSVRLATEEEMEDYFAEYEVGALPALRCRSDVAVLMDRRLNVEGDILFQAGTHRDAICLDFRDWYRLVNPHVAAFSERAEPVHA